MSRNESDNDFSSLNPTTASRSEILEVSEAGSASLHPAAQRNGNVLADNLNVAGSNGPVRPQTSNGSHEDSEHDLRDYLLSIDGGGIRGYSALLILRKLMHKVGELEEQRPCRHHAGAAHSHSPVEYEPPKGSAQTKLEIRELKSYLYLPCHYFDFVAGTSTGGLIAIMLGRLRMTVEDCISEYETLGDKIFGHPRLFSLRGPLPAVRDKYDPRRLAKVVEDVVWRHNPSKGDANNVPFASSEDLCRTIVISIRKDGGGESEDPYLFRSFSSPPLRNPNGPPNWFHRNPGDACQDAISDVAIATTAALTYFPSHRIGKHVFMDGGFGANNPTVEADKEIRQYRKRPDALGLVLSIGTGKSKSRTRFGKGLFGRYLVAVKYARKMATQSEKTHKDMMDDVYWENHRRTAERQKTKKNHPEPLKYERFNVETGLEKMKLDEWKTKHWRVIPRESNETLDHIRAATEEYLDDPIVQAKLDEVADMLVERRRRRIDTPKPAWERWCTGYIWRCNECTHAPFKAPDELKDHLPQLHPHIFENIADGDRQVRLAQMVRDAREFSSSYG